MVLTLTYPIPHMQIETQYVKLRLQDGILFGQFATNIHMNLEIAKHCVETRINFIKHTSYPFVIDLRGIRSISKEAREYMGKEGSQYVTAGALLTNSFLAKTLGNFFLAINTPKVPSKLFDDEEKAIEWLKQFM